MHHAGEPTPRGRWGRRSRALAARLAVLGAVGIGGIAGCGDAPADVGGAPETLRAALAVHAVVQTTTATHVELRAGYLRTGGARVELNARTIALAAAPAQEERFVVELGPCLGDPQRAVPGPACEVELQLRLLRNGALLDVSTVRVQLRPGEARQLADAVQLFEVAELRVTLPGGAPATAARLEVSETLRLGATLADRGGAPVAGRDVQWESATPAVATVDATGLVTGLAAGTATIRVRGGGRTQDVAVTVLPPSVRTITVVPAAVALEAGAERALTVLPLDARGGVLAGRPLAFSSSAPLVATVGADGVVRGLVPGEATVTVTSAEGPDASLVRATVPVTVTRAAVATIAVAPAAVQLEVGEARGLAVAVRDARGNAVPAPTLAFASSDPAVATVGADGAVRAVAPGSATVTVTSREGAGGAVVSATASITVVRAAVASLAVAPAAVTVEAGASQTLAVTPRDARGAPLAGRPVAFASSDPAVAIVDADGAVRGVAPGSATVTVSSAEGANGATVRATVAVTVTRAAVATLAVGAPALQLGTGDVRPLAVTALDARGAVLTGRALTYASSDPAVVTVTADGVVRALRQGSATITITSAEGPNGTSVTTRVSITVVGAGVATLTVTPASLQLAVGESRPLTVNARDGRGNAVPGVAIAFASSNPLVATVTTGGVVRGVGTGTATVTVSADGAVSSVPVTVGPGGGHDGCVLAATPATGVNWAVRINTGNPPPAAVALACAGGAAPGTGVSLVGVAYGAGQPTGWLGAELDGTTLPTTLRLNAGVAGLPTGLFQATVTVRTAAGATLDIPVRLTVTSFDPADCTRTNDPGSFPPASAPRVTPGGTRLSGSRGQFFLPVSLGVQAQQITVAWDMFGVPDAITVCFRGLSIYDSGGLVSGTGSFTFSYPGSPGTDRDDPTQSIYLYLSIRAPNLGTAWDASVAGTYVAPQFPDVPAVPSAAMRAAPSLTDPPLRTPPRPASRPARTP